jgi:hypothetical protein
MNEMQEDKYMYKVVDDLIERAKELNCLYKVQELILDPGKDLDAVCNGIIEAIPPGWQYSDICTSRIELHHRSYTSENFQESQWSLNADIRAQDEIIGMISVFYTEHRPDADEGPFLKEERKLINTIADQLGTHVFHQQLKSVFREQKPEPDEQRSEWSVILDMLEKTDPKLLIRISRKMVNYLGWSGVEEAEYLFEHFSPAYREKLDWMREENRPYQRQPDSDLLAISQEIFDVAAKHLSSKDIHDKIHKWIKEDRSGFMANVLENTGSSLMEICNAIERFYHLAPQGLELSGPREISFKVSLIRRLLSDQASIINVAKKFIKIGAFNDLIKNIISPMGSYGKLGGKSSGLFVSEHIIKKRAQGEELLEKIRIPKTWYLTSDGILSFMNHNNLEDILEQKYKDIDQVRKEYPYVIHVFKNSSFAPEIIKGLLQALDDFGEVPLIIRSSSLLEDRTGTAFAGKYKSLFIANQGSREERLLELTDAIAEVYASTFSPDPIEYRSEKGLLDYHEEMGIMIQEVVGKKVGKYFLPAFAGVAFSRNDFRWSSRLHQKDGLIRMVPGLGTRAVDRLSDDYPILIAPGQPGLKVNASVDEIIRYSPKNVDVINLETATFETIKIENLLKESGQEYPAIHHIASKISDQHIQRARALGMDFKNDHFVVTFDSLIKNTEFVKQISSILKLLENEFGYPVDIEFAHNGTDLFLLQCRAQSHHVESQPAKIPANPDMDKVIFTANKHISNGTIAGITHIVYVDPLEYGELTDRKDLLSVGKAVGRLNKLLPKRQFILMGPGRWGSRGDIKLGVSVGYSEISNTSMLIEIARRQKDYIPELSFGTHFFLDLVESNIRYLPLYPDERNNLFNESFLTGSKNLLPELLPDMESLSRVIHVIDLQDATGGEELVVFMNGVEEKAMAILNPPREKDESARLFSMETQERSSPDKYWRWRQRSAENIAANLDPDRFGVLGFYIFGSTKNATAGPGSDIDIIIHFKGSDAQRENLLTWLEGWSGSLSYLNYLRTGYKVDGLLDIHIVTDEDIQKRDSYALKIGAVTDAARPLRMGHEVSKSKD